MGNAHTPSFNFGVAFVGFPSPPHTILVAKPRATHMLSKCSTNKKIIFSIIRPYFRCISGPLFNSLGTQEPRTPVGIPKEPKYQRVAGKAKVSADRGSLPSSGLMQSWLCLLGGIAGGRLFAISLPLPQGKDLTLVSVGEGGCFECHPGSLRSEILLQPRYHQAHLFTFRGSSFSQSLIKA